METAIGSGGFGATGTGIGGRIIGTIGGIGFGGVTLAGLVSGFCSGFSPKKSALMTMPANKTNAKGGAILAAVEMAWLFIFGLGLLCWI